MMVARNVDEAKNQIMNLLRRKCPNSSRVLSQEINSLEMGSSIREEAINELIEEGILRMPDKSDTRIRYGYVITELGFEKLCN